MLYPGCPANTRHSVPQINNLGGVGPELNAGSKVMRFQSIGVLDGVPFDLLVTNSTPVAYGDEACEAGCDLKNDGVFIELPVAVNSDYWIDMQFVDPATGDSPVIVPAFFLSGFDFDSSPPGGTGNRERVTARANGGTFTFSAGDDIEVVGSDPNVGIEFQTAVSHSGPVPNPSDPLDLTPEQLAVTVTMLFQNASSLSLNLALDDEDPDLVSSLARNLFFAFTETQLVDDTC